MVPISPLSGPWHPPICFQSLWVSPFWTFHINGIKHYMAFSVWLILSQGLSVLWHAPAHQSFLGRRVPPPVARPGFFVRSPVDG